MSLDLNKLANKLDEALSNETSETLNKFLTDKRMSNDEDEKEIELIKQLAEEATMKASSYADAYANGYTAGYERALKLIKWQIDHILPSAMKSTNTQK